MTGISMVEVHNPAGTESIKCRYDKIPEGWLRDWGKTVAGKIETADPSPPEETDEEELARMKAELADLEEEKAAEENTDPAPAEDDDEDGMKALQKEIEDEEAAKAASEDSPEDTP